VLVVPDLDKKKMRMKVDASDYATGEYYLWSINMSDGDQ